MPPIDPFAPADHPNHPSQQPEFKQSQMAAVLSAEAADMEAYEELAATHLTPAERQQRDAVLAGEDPADDAPALPPIGELQVRVDALVDYLERRDTDDSEPPRIVDAFGVEHVLSVNEDGTEAGWEPVERTYQDMHVPELQALLREHGLPVSGNKPELIARLAEFDDEQAAKADEPDGDETNDEMAAKIAELDKAKGEQ